MLFSEDGQYLPVTLKLSNGTEISICPKIRTTNKKSVNEGSDKVKNYGHLVLELGMLFKELLGVCKSPDRNQMLRLLKHSMTVFKARSNNSKYALEIHRFLIQQISTLSEKEAAEVVTGMFVNTKGKADSYIPADLQMEYMVKTIKKHIKHMYSNKSEANIAKQTRSLSGIRDISEHFDRASGVVHRCKKHKKKDSDGDELLMIQDLRKLRPFSFQSGRLHNAFPNIKKSVIEYMNVDHYHSWIRSRIVINANELGQ